MERMELPAFPPMPLSSSKSNSCESMDPKTSPIKGKGAGRVTAVGRLRSLTDSTLARHVGFGLLALVSALSSCTSDNGSPFEPPRDYDQIEEYSEDARVLAARLGGTPWIDLQLTAEIDDALRRTRSLRPEFDSIHPFKDFDLYELIAKAKPDVASIWRRGVTHVGDHYLDSLSTTFSLERVDSLGYLPGVFILTFGVSLNMRYVAELYDRSVQLQYAEPNGYGGDGHQIWAFKKLGIWHLVYSEGRGDCPNGCTWRSFFYVELPQSGLGEVVEERVPGGPPPSSPIARWNIPERFSAILFGDVDNLLAHYDHNDWWVRRHAIEASWRFFARESPMYGEDIGKIWQGMRTEILQRRAEVVERIRTKQADPDEDVRRAAARALEHMGGGD